MMPVSPHSLLQLQCLCGQFNIGGGGAAGGSGAIATISGNAGDASTAITIGQ